MGDIYNINGCVPFVVVTGGIIQDVSEKFIELTGFEKVDLISYQLSVVWRNLFRINTDINLINKEMEVTLFTKSLEVRFAAVSKIENMKKNEIIYKFIEKPNSRLENKMLFIERLISDGKFGVAIYAAQDFKLLKANDMYLKYLPTPFNTKEFSFGRCLEEIFPGSTNGPGEREIRRIIEQNETLYITELQGVWCGSDDRYWDSTIAPIVEEGQVKYLVSVLQDVTERVLSREHVRIKNEQLEAIFNRASDIIFILDKNGKYISGNGSSKMFFDLYIENSYSPQKCFKIFDDDGKELDPEEFHSRVALSGNEIEKVKLNIELDGELKYFKLSVKSINDGKNEMAYRVFVLHDITKEIEKMKTIEQQNRELDTIIENMSDGLIVIDKDGKVIKSNKAFEEANKKVNYVNGVINNINEIQSYGRQYLDENCRELSWEELPFSTILKCQAVKQQRVVSIRGNSRTYAEYSCTPIFDKDGSLQYGILLRHDISKIIENENKIIEQREMLYNSEKSQRELLEKALIMKDEFISLISHEFKTPLNVIYSAIQLIEYMYTNELTGRLKELMKSIKQNTFRQLRLVNNLLDFTRLNSGRLKLHMRNIDIIFLTKMITESVRVYAEQKNISLSFEADIDSKIIAIDDEKYERILLNLLSNAIKFTHDGGDIKINIEENKKLNTLVISVMDTGIGIPKEKQKLIFERFGQVESSLSRQAEGTGIGLSLVKLLVEALEGRIIVKSKLGTGSTFEVILPARECKENEEKETCLDADSRLVNAINVEFSDIYF